MLELLAFYASLCVAAGPISPKTVGRPQETVAAIEVQRFKTATLPEGALARFGGDRFTTLQPLESIEFAEDGTRIACQLDDATLMIWDGERLARFVDEALVRECPKDLSALVDELTSSPQSAYRAARLLAVAGASGVAALRRAMDGRTPEAKRIAGWIRDLDSDFFATRDKAESSLAAWGTAVEKSLRDALNASPSAKKRVRLQRLLSQLVRSPYGNRELAQARAVLALDWNGCPTAPKLLAEWAEKFPESILGIESKFVLANRAER